MKIGSINIRGLGSKIKKGEVKSLFYNSSLDFCCVQETKIEAWSVDCGREIWGRDQIDYCVLNSEGRSGGGFSPSGIEINLQYQAIGLCLEP